MVLFADRMANIGSENAFKVGSDIAIAQSQGRDVIRLNLGEPDFDTPEFICKTACDNLMAGNTHYCPPAGIIPLREALANQISETRGVTIDPETIVVTPGAKPPICYSLLTYINPGDEVIYPSPGFPIYESWATFSGAKPVPLHLKESKGFSFSADELGQLITPKTKLIIINSPSNPTGGVLSSDDILSIAKVINEKSNENVRIYSDEVYENILFDGSEHHSIISAPGMQEKTILVSGHSKSYAMTGWRLGFAVLPSKLEANVFTNLNINIFSCTPPFSQAAGVEAYTNPQSAEIVSKMVKNFEERRNYAVPALNAIEGVTCANPKGAFYVFPNIGGICDTLGVFNHYNSLPADVARKTSPSKLFQMFLIYHHGVATMDRQSFGAIGAKDMHFLRLSTATDLNSIKKGIERIDRASKDKKGFSEFILKGEHLY
ncbi:pyridoxal phosphate-dependent aminotransferase [bacterium]|nr:pyridoxal phosphate-dependent aminotransferase [bacterium]